MHFLLTITHLDRLADVFFEKVTVVITEGETSLRTNSKGLWEVSGGAVHNGNLIGFHYHRDR